jgi:hypothetical protein
VKKRIDSSQYDALCTVIDEIKTADRSLDTDEYAGKLLEAIGGADVRQSVPGLPTQEQYAAFGRLAAATMATTEEWDSDVLQFLSDDSLTVLGQSVGDMEGAALARWLLLTPLLGIEPTESQLELLQECVECGREDMVQPGFCSRHFPKGAWI